jgi:hypothetical protein
MKGIGNLPLLLAFLSLFFLSGCGGSNRQLQSITINPASTTAQGGQAQFTATGQFNMSPMTMSPAAVAWFPSFPVIDPVSSGFGFSLTNQPFTAQCLISGTMTVTAIAPMDTNASANGFIPISVFMDLVRNQTATQEGGFVAATAQLACP